MVMGGGWVAAAPSPCTTRKGIRAGKEGGRARRGEPARKSAVATRKGGLRPTCAPGVATLITPRAEGGRSAGDDQAARGPALADRGQRLLRRAREALDALRAGTSELHELAQTPRGPVSIGALPTVGAYLLPPLIEAFLQQNPQVQMRLVEGPAGELEKRVSGGGLDFAVTTPPLARLDLIAQKLWSEPFMLAVPPGHRLAPPRPPGAPAAA